MLPKLYSDSRDRLMVWARRTPSRRLATDATVDVFAVGLVDSAMTLAAQAFTSLLPVMIAASTLEKLKPLADAAKDDLGVQLPDAQIINTSTAAAFGIVGLLMLLISSTSYARALGRMYGRIWSVPTATLRQAWRWIAVVFVVATSVVGAALCRELNGVPGWADSWNLLRSTWCGRSSGLPCRCC
ncbi:hypothetical protein GCM10020255_034510 [Rhodococcus baikonurensis]